MSEKVGDTTDTGRLTSCFGGKPSMPEVVTQVLIEPPASPEEAANDMDIYISFEHQWYLF